MNLWESGPIDGFIKIDGGWVRTSRVESVVVQDKQWGTTTAGEPLYRAHVTLIGGATFTHLTPDAEKLVRVIVGDS